MPCGITVFPSLVKVGAGAGHFEVQGSALDCTDVSVRIEFDGNSILADAVRFEGGIWTAVFPLFASFECGSDVALTVIADCRPTPCPGGAARKAGAFRVKCRNDDCVKSSAGVQVRRLSADCDENGEQRMEFSIRFSPPLPTGTEGHFAVIDASDENVGNTGPDEADAAGTFIGRLSLPPGRYVVAFRASGPAGCSQGEIFEVAACACPSGDLVVRDRQGSELGRVALGRTLRLGDCVPAASGPFELSVTHPTQLAGVTYTWHRDDASLSGEATSRIGDVTLPANGDSVTYRVRVERAGCPAEEATVTLAACLPANCPPFGLVEVRKGGADGDVVFEIIEQDASGQPPPSGVRLVSGEQGVPCLVAGTYTLVVRGFDPTYRYYWYDGDGTRKGEISDGTLRYDVIAGGSSDDTISVGAAHPQIPGTDCFRLAIPMFVCDCESRVSIALFDVSRDVGRKRVGPEECLVPGSYEARAEGPDPRRTEYRWKLNPRDAQDVRGETGAVMSFEALPGFFCGNAYDIEVEARPRENEEACGHRASRTAVVCPDWVGCMECWLLRLILMVILAMILAALAFSICPSLTEIPWLRWLAIALTSGGDASYVGRAAWVVWGVTHTVFFTASRIFILIAALAFIAGIFVFIAYLKYCRVSRCYDWTVLVWQSLLVLGFALAFYGSCPSCIPFQEYLLPGGYASNAGGAAITVGLGVLIMLVGIVLWALWWWVFCKPNICRALFELGSLAFTVNLLGAGLPAYILAPCLWQHGWVLMSIVLFFGSAVMTAAVLCGLYTMRARSRSQPR